MRAIRRGDRRGTADHRISRVEFHGAAQQPFSLRFAGQGLERGLPSRTTPARDAHPICSTALRVILDLDEKGAVFNGKCHAGLLRGLFKRCLEDPLRVFADRQAAHQAFANRRLHGCVRYLLGVVFRTLDSLEYVPYPLDPTQPLNDMVPVNSCRGCQQRIRCWHKVTSRTS